MPADAAVSAVVVVAGFIVLFTGWLWLNPLVSLTIVAVIASGIWGLLLDSMGMSLAALPREIEPAIVVDFLKARPGVIDIHGLHIWPMSTSETALTAQGRGVGRTQKKPRDSCRTAGSKEAS